MCTDMLRTSGYLLHACCLPENLLFCCLSFFILFISQDQASITQTTLILSFIPPHDIVIRVLNVNQSIQFQASSRGGHKLQRCICLVFNLFFTCGCHFLCVMSSWELSPLCLGPNNSHHEWEREWREGWASRKLSLPWNF